MGLDTISMSNCRYRGYFADLDGGKWQCDILTGGGMAGEIKLMNDSPLTIEWRSDGVMDQVVKSRATLRVLSTSDMKFADLYSVSGTDAYLAVYRNNKLYWIGSIEPEQYEEPYSYKENYVTELTFHDLSILDRARFDLTGILSIADLIRVLVSDAYRPSFTCDWVQDIPRPEIVFNCSTRASSLSASNLSAVVVNDDPDYINNPTPGDPEYPNPNPHPLDPDAPGAYDPNGTWHQQLQDEVSVARKGAELLEAVQVVPSAHTVGAGSLSLSSYKLNSGAQALEKTYVNCDNFYSDDGEGMSKLEVLTELLKPFALRIEQRNGRFQVYDIHGAHRWLKKTLKARGADATFGVDRVYNSAVVRVSLAENTTLLKDAPIKKIKTPIKDVKVPRIDTYEDFDAYSLKLGENPDTALLPSSMCDKTAYVFETKAVSVGSKERGIAIIAGDKREGHVIIHGITFVHYKVKKGKPLGLPNYDAKKNALSALKLPDVNSSNVCLSIKGVRLPVRTKDMTENYFLGLSLDVMFSPSYSIFQPNTDDNTSGWGKAGDIIRHSIKELRLPLKVYACDKDGNRLKVLNSVFSMDDFSLWGFIFGVEDPNKLLASPVWEDIATTNRQFAIVQYGQSNGDAFNIDGWNKPLPKSSNSDYSMLIKVADMYDSRFVFPIPPVGESLDIEVINMPLISGGAGVTNLLECINTFAIKNLSLDLVRADGSSPEEEDLVYKAWLNTQAYEEYEETLMLTSDPLATPCSLSLLLDKDGNRCSHRFSRGASTATIEQLYLNTVFTAYSVRHNRISGSYAPMRGMFPISEMGKTYLVVNESENCRASVSEIEMIEIERDRWVATELEED